MAKNNQSAKARMGAIGESLVVAKLMQQGWDAFNATAQSRITSLSTSSALTATYVKTEI